MFRYEQSLGLASLSKLNLLFSFQGMDTNRLTGILRTIRASNCRKGVGEFHIVLFGCQELLAMGQKSATKELCAVESGYILQLKVVNFELIRIHLRSKPADKQSRPLSLRYFCTVDG